MRTPPTGWDVRLTHSSGHVHRPDPLGSISKAPAIRDLPRITVPVERDRLWQDDGFERALFQAWKDSEQLPIEQLDDVGERRASGTSQTTLEGVGGVELRQRVEREVSARETHSFIEDLIVNETGLVANVDTPAVHETTRMLLDVATASEWADALSETDLSTLPVEIDSGTDELALQQSLWTTEGENYTRNSGTGFTSSADYSGDAPTDGNGGAERLSGDNNYVEWEFDVDYTIPEEHVVLHIRDNTDVGGDGNPEIQIWLDGNLCAVLPASSAGITSLNWSEWSSDPSGNSYSGGDLQPGTHTLRAEVASDDTGWYDVDVVAPGDGRYSYSLDNSVTTAPDGSNYLDGPEHHPDAVQITMDRVTTVLSLTEADLTSTWDDTSGSQAVGMRNQTGDSFDTASNASSHSVDFADRGALLDVQLTLSRYGSQTSTPGSGISGQRVADLSVEGALDDMPLTIDRTFDDTILSICKTLAEEANAVFGVDRAPNGDLTFEWTQLGQRTSDPVDGAETIDASTDYDVTERAIVYGGSQPIRREPITADVGNAVELNEARLQERSETVRSADSDTDYTRGDDYDVSWQDGTITAISGGNISDGESLEVDYSFQPRGSHVASGAGSDPRTEVVNIPGLSSERACGLAAYRIVQETKTPLHEATVQLPEDVAVSVVESVPVEELPQDEALDLRSIQTTPQSTQLTLGSRQRVEDVVSDIKSRIRGVSRKV